MENLSFLSPALSIRLFLVLNRCRLFWLSTVVHHSSSSDHHLCTLSSFSYFDHFITYSYALCMREFGCIVTVQHTIPKPVMNLLFCKFIKFLPLHCSTWVFLCYFLVIIFFIFFGFTRTSGF